MSSGTRIYVGNLSSNITEKDVQKYVKKFGSVQDICIKHRKDHIGNITSTFAHLTFSEKGSLQPCLDFLNHQKWNGIQLKAEIAKETYLKRMAARCQNASEGLESVDQPPEYLIKSPQRKKDKQKNSSTKKKSTGSLIKEGQVIESDEESDVEIFWKKDHIAQNVVTLESEILPNPALVNKTNNGNNLLQKFESFSSVWNDSSSSDAMLSNIFPSKHNFNSFSDEKQTPGRENSTQSFSKNKIVVDNRKSEDVLLLKTPGTINLPKTSKKQQGEEKRLQSLKERMNAFETQQATVKKALAGEPVNKRIKFDSEEITESQMEKPQLFEEEEDSDGENTSNDFAIRKQFEGKRGEKLLELQSRFTTDERFRLDSRFAESDSDKEDNPENNENEPSSEQKKHLSIIDSILGPDQIITSKHLQRTKRGLKAIVRYDPTKPEHSKKYINSEEVPPKKNKQDEETAVMETPLPEVSQEKFYEVSESLHKTLLPGASNAFSLRSLFGEQDEPVQEGQQTTAKSEHQKKSIKNSISMEKDSSKDNEEDSSKRQNTSAAGTWHESFFFKPDDTRFKEGISFFQAAVPESKENFDKQRQVILKSVKNKLNVVSKKKITFERKLGGRASKKSIKGGKKIIKV